MPDGCPSLLDAEANVKIVIEIFRSNLCLGIQSKSKLTKERWHHSSIRTAKLMDERVYLLGKSIEQMP